MAEFAAYGIAGARVDRIAAAAECNKQLIYAYFNSKEGLFDAVYETMVTRTVDSVPTDGFDLPGYAGRLFDRYRAHPEALRLSTWRQFERGDGPSPVAIQSARDKIEAIQAAQDAGAVTLRYQADELLALVLKLATIGGRDSLEAAILDKPAEAFREVVLRAVARLVAPD